MINDRELAVRINKELLEISARLDETAALVRATTTEDADEYISALGKVLYSIATDLFEPLYKDHPELAPESWKF